MILGCLLIGTRPVHAASSSFSFTLDEPCKTSAGVFSTNGTLIRTLWSKVRYYAAGTYTAVWDGLDDNSNAMPAGVYQIKLLQHNVEYVWDGAIGNTSAEVSGPTVHRGFQPIFDMSITGINAFYVSGYDEAHYDFRSFITTDPQHVNSAWVWAYDRFGTSIGNNTSGTYDRNWAWTTTDTNWVYFACSAGYNPITGANNAYPGFVVASKVSDHSLAYFTNGVAITNGPPNIVGNYPNGIYVGTQPGLSGMSVQQNGNLLAVAVAPDNEVYLINKLSGDAISKFTITSPGRLSFSPDGSLWVITGNNLVCYTNLTLNPAIVTTISGLKEPLAVAVNPTNPAIILVADGGASQQLKAFNGHGAALWTYGLPGGYQSNGVAVATNKFWFSYNGVDQTFLCFAKDASFWVGDEENHRSLHFSSAAQYIEQIMYQPLSHSSCIDQNNNSRIFNQFLEFNVDYTKPLSTAWTLVNNWKANVDSNHIAGLEQGLSGVTTFTNGRTYGLIDNVSAPQADDYNLRELCELTTNGLRCSGLFPMSNSAARWNSFGADGSALATTILAAKWYQSTLHGFDTNGNPIWNPETLIASASQGATDPYPRIGSWGFNCTAISTNNILVSLDSTRNNGYHLGGIRLGGTNWLWKVSPSASLNGCGNYEIGNGVNYAGNAVQTMDRNVIFGYHGEIFRSVAEAGQYMHYLDDGLFVGQFGEASIEHFPYEGVLPGFAGNNFCPNLTKATNGDYYVWDNDESAHGPQRWHLVNAKNIREQAGLGALGTTISLSNQVYIFPCGLIGRNDNTSAQLFWQSVPGANSYNVRYSLTNGGAYTVLAGNTTNTSYLARGLTNGQTYYFVVTAIQAGTEGPTSEQIQLNPFDTAQNVLLAGSASEGEQLDVVVDINSTARSFGNPSYIGGEYTTGVLNLRERDYYGYGSLENESIGTQGYVIYDWRGAGSQLVNVPTSITITLGSGWIDTIHLNRDYKVDGVLSADCLYTNLADQIKQNGIANGLMGNPIGSIAIGVTDTNYHFLTVVSPNQGSPPNARNFTLGITSTNGSSVQYTVNENGGYSHVFQFLFRGNITLTANGVGGAGAVVQALFFDDAAWTSEPSPPTGLQIVGH